MLIGCGVAAAISACFNAPIAALFFHEAVLRHFSTRAVALISISYCASAFDGFCFQRIVFWFTPISVSSEMMLISLLAGTFLV